MLKTDERKSKICKHGVMGSNVHVDKLAIGLQNIELLMLASTVNSHYAG